MGKFGSLFTDSQPESTTKSTSRFGSLFKDPEKEIEEQEDSLVTADAYDSEAEGIDAWAQDQERMDNLSRYMVSRFG